MDRKQTQKNDPAATRLRRQAPQTQSALIVLLPGNFLLPGIRKNDLKIQVRK